VNQHGAVPSTAMVMAAGLGTRMRPLTESRPKPLIEVAGKPLIDHVLDRLRAAGVGRIVVNVHYLADAIEEHLEAHHDDLELAVSDERDVLLETGGGMVRAEPLIPSDPFLAINSDNFWTDGPEDSLRRLAAGWRDGEMDFLLLLVPRERAGNHSGKGDFFMEADGRLVRRGQAESAPLVFTGIQLVSKRILQDAPEGPFSTNILWDRAIGRGSCFGVVHQGLWFDVGTPSSIAETERALQHG